MPAQIFGTDAAVTILNRAFNDASPSNATFLNQKAAAGSTTDSQNAFALQFGAGFAGLTADALSTKLLGNLGLLPNTGLQSAFKDYITASGVSNIGLIALQLGQILSGLENATGEQAAFNAAALAWNNEVTAGYNYSANPTSTTPSTPGSTAPGQTFTLTTGSDFADVAGSFRNGSTVDSGFKFTSGNETVNATVATFANVAVAPANNDSLADGSTTDNDVLNLALGAAGGTIGAMSNIETVNLITTAGTGAATLGFGASTVSGVKTITVTGAGTGVVDVTSGSTSAAFARANDVDSTGLTGTGSIVFNAGGRSGAPAEQAITVKLGGQGASSVTTSGGADNVTGGLGNDTISTGAGADIIKSGGGNDIIDGGSGNDTIDAGAGNNSITGGAGDDAITITSGTVDTVVFGGIGAVNPNGKDTITGFTAGSGSGADKLNFTAHVGNGGVAATGIIALSATGGLDVGDIDGLGADAGSTTANSVLVLDRGLAIGAENYSSATDFAKIFAGSAAIKTTALGAFAAPTSSQTVLVVQGTDQTQIYAIDTARDGVATNITADDVVLVGVLTDTTNVSAFANGNFIV